MTTFFFKPKHALLRILHVVALAGLWMAPGAPARATESAWQQEAHVALRLIGGGAASAGTHLAGIEIRLDPGWKTYWRVPGDSGVPPRFDFSASTNVKSAEVAWPAPHAFPDGAGGSSIGYAGEVILPLHVTLHDAARPATLQMHIDYAICEKICVPVRASATLPLAAASAPLPPLQAALARVPKPLPLGAEGPLAIRSLHRDKQRILVSVAVPPGTADVELFAEGADPAWPLPLPQPLPAEGGLHRFTFSLEGAPDKTQARGAALHLTLRAGDRAIETHTTLP